MTAVLSGTSLAAKFDTFGIKVATSSHSAVDCSRPHALDNPFVVRRMDLCLMLNPERIGNQSILYLVYHMWNIVIPAIRDSGSKIGYLERRGKNLSLTNGLNRKQTK